MKTETLRVAAIGIDLGDVWGHYRFVSEIGTVVEQGRVKMTRRGLSDLLGDMAPTRVAIEACVNSLWVSEHLIEMGHEVLVANVRELRAISDSNRKHDRADAEKLARYARVDSSILSPVKHRSRLAHADLVLIRSRAALVEARTQLSNTARSLVKPFGYRLPPISVSGYANKVLTNVPERLHTALVPLLSLIDSLTEQIRSLDQQLEKLANEKYPETTLLRQVQRSARAVLLSLVRTFRDSTSLPTADYRRFETLRSCFQSSSWTDRHSRASSRHCCRYRRQRRSLSRPRLRPPGRLNPPLRVWTVE